MRLASAQARQPATRCEAVCPGSPHASLYGCRTQVSGNGGVVSLRMEPAAIPSRGIGDNLLIIFPIRRQSHSGLPIPSPWGSESAGGRCGGGLRSSPPRRRGPFRFPARGGCARLTGTMGILPVGNTGTMGVPPVGNWGDGRPARRAATPLPLDNSRKLLTAPTGVCPLGTLREPIS